MNLKARAEAITKYIEDEKARKFFNRKIIQLAKEYALSVIEPHLKYCKQQNGLDHCKNCGLSYPLKDTELRNKVEGDRG